MDGLDASFITHVCLVILSLFLCLFNIMVSTLNLNRVEDHINEMNNRISMLETDYYGSVEESKQEPEQEPETEAEESEQNSIKEE